ncbi:succinylglutamate desuccinylase/aspartoacylase family protein [Lentiprolixibacter aurantiacus]|uniref:Succinylglutamate desuccinylase/aspartoacylase family protein n=1 Tax=Lentiprolixibacter aurantiacus TaxID=2993939 RepID=A0AAE3MKD6_9FLAO|nr:succinylglutamate desuccinylase/aspartoacylase family protein [Lentiprolixibacter aurantiacus]MCX2718494.1 succinylglutamate desuccinylase/aspartoacylase family protein [Lentiprolixibacter aurantiacus]
MANSPVKEMEVETSRIIGKLQGKESGPTVIFFGGIHGNEPSGVQALEQVFTEVDKLGIDIRGTVYGIRGNIPALKQEKRFLSFDLNRMWTRKGIDGLKNNHQEERRDEEKEMEEIYRFLKEVLDSKPPPYYFIDYHTTSSQTLPFITINDAMINRKFARLFPVPVILGIEEYLEGPLLSYINEKGYVTIGFESGQHFKEESAANSVAFTWLTMMITGIMEPHPEIDKKALCRQLQASAQGNRNFYEVIHRHKITSEDKFEMILGAQSFEHLEKGTRFARHNGEIISAEKDTILFMPLYQDQGEEGFFLIRKIPKWALRFSAFLRHIRFDNFLTWLPGINRVSERSESLMVNLKVARFFSKPFFHLLGYRERVIDRTHMVLYNRERAAKNSMYEKTSWYK